MVNIYWIRYDHHTDPLNEGYIGVSVEPEKRFMYHAHESRNNNEILYRAIQKGARQEILYTFESKDEAYAKEIEMRPTPKIGWNIIPGGDSKPPVHWGNTWYRFKGEQPKVSCIECRKVCSWHKLTTHTCRKVCATEGCDNRVKKIHASHCSLSCAATEKGKKRTKEFRARVGSCSREGCDNLLKRPFRKYCSRECAGKCYNRRKSNG